MKFAQIMVQVVLVATVVAGVAAFTPYGYFGWEANGCSATPLDPAEYNSVDTWAVSQWWTITFTHDTLPLGGMINYLRMGAGAVAVLQVTLTNGVNGANQVVIANQIHALGFSTTPTGFCVGSPTSSAYGCIDQSVPDAELNSYGAGIGTDGTPFKYELLFARQMNDTWCLMDDASSAINVTGQSVTWYHFAPAATVEGSLIIGNQSFAFAGVGQQDHVFGSFIPTVTLFKHWIDGHFYNSDSGFVMYWGAMADTWAFARIELPGVGYMFDAVEHTETYAPNSTRPTSYTVQGSNAQGDTFHVTCTPLVPNVDFGSNPVEDIVTLTGTVCQGGMDSDDCLSVSGRGWTQIIGGPYSP